MLAACELVVDRLDRVAGVGDEEVRDRDRAARRHAVGPSGPPRLALCARDANVVATLAVDEEVRLLPADRRGVERRVRNADPRIRRLNRCRWRAAGVAGVVRCTDHPREHLVPDRVGPDADLAVAGDPLLLGTVDQHTGFRVGDEAAARELRARSAVVHQAEVAAVHLYAAHRGSLGDGPEVRRCLAAALAGAVHVDRQVGDAAPEVVEREALDSGVREVVVRAVGSVEATVEDLDLAVDLHVVRRGTQTSHLGVIADGDLQRIGVGSVLAGHEQQAVSVRTHLGVALLQPQGIGRRLDLAGRHARIEDDHIG